MSITKKTAGGLTYAWVNSDELVITDVQSALDLMATVKYETDCRTVVINKEAICEEFFDLKTRVAGEILQKFVQYQTKIAIVGDFSVYDSHALRDFIYESNRGKQNFFVASEEEAVALLQKL
ncbi:hypothetical protein M2140_001648 [Clostridiales Family XIII bacterium PM5-7]